MKTQTIAVNNIEIDITRENNIQYVAIKPICKALGVKYDPQIEKIKEDEILSQLTLLRGVTGADGKTYKMIVLPLRYIFGWLFTINPKNVKPEIKETIINYRQECYDALFDTFTKRTSILKERTKLQLEVEKLEKELKEDSKYKKVQELKNEIKKNSTKLNNLDKNIIVEQLDMFKN